MKKRIIFKRGDPNFSNIRWVLKARGVRRPELNFTAVHQILTSNYLYATDGKVLHGAFVDAPKEEARWMVHANTKNRIELRRAHAVPYLAVDTQFHRPRGNVRSFDLNLGNINDTIAILARAINLSTSIDAKLVKQLGRGRFEVSISDKPREPIKFYNKRLGRVAWVMLRRL